MIKIYYVPCHKEGTREYKLIKQGLVNNSKVELVDNAKESDFVFYFYFTSKHKEYYTQKFPPKKTVVIDYHDRVHWVFPFKNIAYFKRSWVEKVKHEDYTTKRPITRPPHFHPLTMAIMDEFIIEENMKRDIALSCPLRIKPGNPNRQKVLNLLRGMDIQGNTQIGEFNRGSMRGFNDTNMRNYFKLLKRSRIIVTCNPSRWEGDHRTWEAFASGALVFIDRMWTPMAHPLIDGEHCIFYDLSDKGLEGLKQKILYFTSDNPLLATEIAAAGHEFTMRYHRTSNRIDEILDVIT